MVFSLGNKIDRNLKPLLNLTQRKKIPVIVCYRGDIKRIKNRIINLSGKIKYEYSYISAISAEISPQAIDKLSEDFMVNYILKDHKASLCLKKAYESLKISSFKKFELTGKLVGIGLIDTGVFPHKDIIDKRNPVKLFEDLIFGYKKPYDDNGHGTFITGCLSGYDNYGICPDSSIIMIKAFDAAGLGFVSDIIRGIEIILNNKERHNIRLLCLPFEVPINLKIKHDPLEEIINLCISKGVCVVAPSGNMGPGPYSINCPGSIKDVITVGGIEGESINMHVPIYSGRGPTLDGIDKPDIAAPSTNIRSLSSNISYNPSQSRIEQPREPYTVMSGTSISCGIITGILSLIIEKSPELTPEDLKSLILYSTISLGENKYSQGKGCFISDKIIK